MDKIHIEKGSVQETLIIPLYGRKLCAEQFPTMYQDEYAAKICESIDYDFSKIEAKKNNMMYQFGGLEGAIREKDMLWEIADYWSGELGRKQIAACQASKRGGYLYCELRGNGRINISGKAALVAVSDIVAEL